jgi:hypothetical protein
VFGNGEIDPEYRRNRNQRMYVRAVGNVFDDRFTRVETLLRSFGCFLAVLL